MFEELKTIELSGEKYPIKCDLAVLEKIQEEFGDFKDFEDGLRIWVPVLDEYGNEVEDEKGKIMTEFKLPDIPTLSKALYFMVNEGEKIVAEEEGRAPVIRTREEIARKADSGLAVIAMRLFDEYLHCFSVKNGKATQNQANPENQTGREMKDRN